MGPTQLTKQLICGLYKCLDVTPITASKVIWFNGSFEQPNATLLTTGYVCVKPPFFFVRAKEYPSKGHLNCDHASASCVLSNCWNASSKTAVLMRIPPILWLPTEESSTVQEVHFTKEISLSRPKQDFGITAALWLLPSQRQQLPLLLDWHWLSLLQIPLHSIKWYKNLLKLYLFRNN